MREWYDASHRAIRGVDGNFLVYGALRQRITRVVCTAVWALMFSTNVSAMPGLVDGESHAGVPAFQVVSPAGKTNLIIPSMHVAAEELTEPSAAVFNGARRLVVEHYGVEGAAVAADQDQGRLAEWALDLSESDLATYFTRARCAGVSKDVAEAALRRPSSQVANAYAYQTCRPTLALSRDTLLMLYKPPHVPLDVLEDDADVERLRRSVTDRDAGPAFRWALRHNPAEVLATTAVALNKGDFGAVKRSVVESLASPDAAQRFLSTMVDERNRRWMPHLRRYLDDGEAVVLVGAMHLPGQQGLLALLRDEGYRVTEVRLPPR